MYIGNWSVGDYRTPVSADVFICAKNTRSGKNLKFSFRLGQQEFSLFVKCMAKIDQLKEKDSLKGFGQIQRRNISTVIGQNSVNPKF